MRLLTPFTDAIELTSHVSIVLEKASTRQGPKEWERKRRKCARERIAIAARGVAFPPLLKMMCDG
jgi:hypothetical protein